MAISRAQMRRQLYMGGGIASLEPRQQYGLGSIVKSVKKAVKGVGDAVGDIVSSDLGKAALLYAVTGGLGHLGAGGSFGGLFKLGTYAPSMVGSNLLTSATRAGVALKGALGSSATSLPKIGKTAKIAGGILGGSALLTSLFGSPDQAQEAFNRDPGYVKSALAKYYKNINKDASEEEVQNFVNQNILEFGDVSRSDVVSGYEKNIQSNLGDAMYAAEGGRVMKEMGGIMDIPMGEPRMNQRGINELDYRQEGGFVPVGIKEKADDVPAMLSKNEFVMTADAVRGMGNGSIENGAQKMYNLMKSLENRIA